MKKLKSKSINDKKWTDRRLPGPFIWFGGKGSHMLPKLINCLPVLDRYVEPYAGAASVFFTKERSSTEIINDLDWRIVNLFRVIRSQTQFPELHHRIYFTPYHRDEFIKAIDMLEERSSSSLMNAWAFFVAQNQGYGGISYLPGHWGRAFSDDKGVAKKVNTYTLRVDRLPRHHKRLQGVSVISRDAIEVIKEYDGEDTSMYLDPPYTPGSRVNKKVYSIDQNISHHYDLIDTLLHCKSAIVLSGYDDPIYEPLTENGWERIDIQSYASAAARNRGTKTVGSGALKKNAPRTEIIWRNKRAMEMKPLD